MDQLHTVRLSADFMLQVFGGDAGAGGVVVASAPRPIGGPG